MVESVQCLSGLSMLMSNSFAPIENLVNGSPNERVNFKIETVRTVF